MSFAKKQKYSSGYLKSIDRKVSYTEPIFLIDVQFDDSSSIYEGGSEKNMETYEIHLPVQLEKSKGLLINIAYFTDLDKSRTVISGLLRDIVLGRPVTEHLSINQKIIDNYKAKLDKHSDKYELLEFPNNAIANIDNLTKKATSIAVIDFDVVDQKTANIAATLKQLFFKYTGKVVITSKTTLINYMKKLNYAVSVEIDTENSRVNVITRYCLLFTQESKNQPKQRLP